MSDQAQTPTPAPEATAPPTPSPAPVAAGPETTPASPPPSIPPSVQRQESELFSGRQVVEHAVQDDILQMLEFDPFKTAPLKPPTPAPAAPVPPAPVAPAAATPAAKQEPSGQVPAVAPSTAPAQAPDPRDRMLNEAMQQMAAMRETIAQLTTRLGAPAAAPQGAAPAGPEGEPVEFPEVYNRLTVPDQMIDELAHEDRAVRKNAMQNLVRGIAQVLHNEVIQSFRKEMPTRVGRMMQEHTATENYRKQVEDDYYGNFPQHRTVRSFVAQVVPTVMQELRASSWTPEVRNAVGKRVQDLLVAMAAGVMPQQQPAPMAPPVVPAAPPAAPVAQPQKPPVIFGGNASPSLGAGGGGSPNTPDEIARALFS